MQDLGGHGNRQAYYGNGTLCRPHVQTIQARIALWGREMDGGTSSEGDEERI